MINNLMLVKDNEITKILGEIPQSDYFEVILKGGTSLTKGYGIGERMSEDIDILVIPKVSDYTNAKALRFIKEIRGYFKSKYKVTNENPPGGGRTHFACTLTWEDTTSHQIKVDIRFDKNENEAIEFKRMIIKEFTDAGDLIETGTDFLFADLTTTFFDKIFAFQNKAYTELVQHTRRRGKVIVIDEAEIKTNKLNSQQIKRLARHAFDITKIFPMISFDLERINTHLSLEKSSYSLKDDNKSWLKRSYNNSLNKFLIFTKKQEIKEWLSMIEGDFINALDVNTVLKEITEIQTFISQLY
ncbi:MAG: nucleotidyl transferase AbiEii/AbiGii toxin family protein [Mycoplasmatales bacterium]|nr:nucleotidyl transferase AbiEii/AbiGii toxin family protein [Mycoplasmatales bacterium]